MGLKNLTIPVLTSLGIMHGVSGYNPNFDKGFPEKETVKTEQIQKSEQDYLNERDIILASSTEDSIKNQIFVCLVTDDENSFMHTKVLESIENPENTVLELPIAQLFQTYGNKEHPLYVKGVSKNFRALVGKNGLEKGLKQSFSTHKSKVTTETAYLIDDTLRFSLINPKIKDDFSEDLRDQLQEPGFEGFSDLENPRNDNTEKGEPYYDIVVKKVPSGRSALSLYKNGKLFMATYVSIGLNSNKTRMGQFQIERSDAYKRSIKYDDAAMPFALNYSGGYFFHQGNVTGNPASHGCVRLPGVYASVLYSLVKNKPHTDVFICKDLYKIEK